MFSCCEKVYSSGAGQGQKKAPDLMPGVSCGSFQNRLSVYRNRRSVYRDRLLVYGNAVPLLLEALEHCNAVPLVVIDEAAVPVFKRGEEGVTAVLVV